MMSPIRVGRRGDAVTMGGARVAHPGRQNAPLQSRPCDRIREADPQAAPVCERCRSGKTLTREVVSDVWR
jgi:hypothetical protein